MPAFSKADHSISPPVVTIPRRYNAAHDLVERNLAAGRGEKIAYIDDAGSYSYAELAQRVDRAGNALRSLGIGMEARVMLCLLDSIEFPAAFLGAIKAGIRCVGNRSVAVVGGHAVAGVAHSNDRKRIVVTIRIVVLGIRSSQKLTKLTCARQTP